MSEIDWKKDDWPKECKCGYMAENEIDAVRHGANEHPEEVLEE